MRKVYIGALVLLLVVSLFAIDSLDLLTSKVQAQDEMTEQDYNTVEVYGNGKLFVEPDIAYINVGVQSEDDDPSVAQQRNKFAMDKIINELKDYGLNEEDMKTINYNIYKRYNYIREDEREEVYVVSNSLQITVKDIDKVGEIIDIASDNGANNINSLRFSVEDDSEYYQQALKIAMNNAKGKADSIMSTFTTSMQPGNPYKVIELSNNVGPVYEAAADMAFEEAKSVTTPIQSGDITIDARVKVIYKY